jgi:hypothetical protein
MSKIVKLIIYGLLITLSILSFCTYKSYERNKQAKLQQNINNQTKQEQTFRVIDKDSIIQTLNKENSINVLSGTIGTRCTFTNKNISQEDVSMKWLKNKIETWNSKDITIDSQFTYMFSYDLRQPQVSIRNNTIYIQLSYNRLSLTKCELSDVQTQERIGWLQNNFSSSEINSLNSRVKDYAQNTILSNEKLRKSSIENTKENIKYLIQSFVSKDINIEFSISDYDVIEQNDVSIIG